MNFCKENDKYISLFIDELLDDKSKINFLEHTEECSECATKLKEASYFAELCRDNQDIQLPEDFASSLHRRLLEVHPKQYKSNLSLFLHNKKLIASLSTAAILVISLLGYNLLPQMSTQKDAASTAYEMAKDESTSAADSLYGSSEDKKSLAGGSSAEGASLDSAVPSVQADSTETGEDKDVHVAFSKAVPSASRKVVEPSSQERVEPNSNSNDSAKEKETRNDATLGIMKIEDPADPNNQFFLNYAELNLKITPGGIEIEELRKFMIELGAIEQKPVTISNVVTTPVESTTMTALEGSQYIDYYLPLSFFSTLESQAKTYKLELSTKTDIIKNDITDIYNELNTQRLKIDEKIKEVLNRGEDTSTFEAEKTRLTEEMNKIITEREMVTVRVFFIDR